MCTLKVQAVYAGLDDLRIDANQESLVNHLVNIHKQVKNLDTTISTIKWIPCLIQEKSALWAL